MLMTSCRNAARSQVRIRVRGSKHLTPALTGYNTGYEPVMVCYPFRDLCQLRIIHFFQNIHLTWAKSLTISGILYFHLEAKYDKEFYATIPPLIAAGEIKYKEEVSQGLESVGDAILRVQQGRNTAKAVVIVAEE